MARLDRSAAAPLHVQLYESLRGLILTGQLEIGARLPSTRELACELGISRSTVVTAYERLSSEGYIEGRLGAGSAVSTALPDPPATAGAPVDPLAGPVRQLSARGALIASMPAPDEGGACGRAFTTGMPALDRFPWDIWSRLVAHVARHLPPETHGYQDPAGHAPLRQAIAAYVGVRRGIPCTAAQVIVVSGAQEAIALAAHVLLDPGDQVWVEEPGYPGARAALQAAGAELVPVPVDQQGLRIAAGHTLCPYPRLVSVTPAHQFPLGATLSRRRRLALLDWARHSGAWILEDDCDAEYRYAGPPVPALRSLDRSGSVVSVGTFSMVTFPALRIGYVIAPEPLVEAFTLARRCLTRQAPIMEQAALHEFIDRGHFGRHVRRMRTLYGERREALLAALRRELPDCRPAPAEGGMHLALLLPPGAGDVAIADAARERDVTVRPLSPLSLRGDGVQGLLLGFAAVSQDEIERGVAVLRDVIAERTR